MASMMVSVGAACPVARRSRRGHSGGELTECVTELVRLAHVGFGGQAERGEPDGGGGVCGQRLLPVEYW
jgi:hypothetical protein